MPDDRLRRDEPGRNRIDIRESHDVEYWAGQFGVSRDRLIEVVKVVGPATRNVKAFLDAPKAPRPLELKVIQIGNSLGVTLPKEVLNALNVDKGDTLTFTAAPDGFRITPYDQEKARQFEIVRNIMKRRRNALRELAK
ncbi:MAG TPA: DUF3606 domain-containing protein [Rhizomicrobium sp.]|nr:DUF3606 domain-containing protein [Rhizomicrobium sp.]